MNYSVDFFIAKFERIPEELWCIAMFDDGAGKHCALGHCGTKNGFKELVGEAVGLNILFCGISEKIGRYVSVVEINDGHDPNYQQPTPKQRILGALYDIKKMQQPKELPAKKMEYTIKNSEIIKESGELVLMN